MNDELHTFLREHRSWMVSDACDEAIPALRMDRDTLVETLDTLVDGLFHDIEEGSGPHPVDTSALDFDNVERVCRMHLSLRRAVLRRIRKIDFRGSGFQSLEFEAERRLDDQLTRLVKHCAETGRRHFEERERTRAAHFATINDVAQMALSAHDPKEILRRVVSGVRERFDYHHVSLYLFDADAGEAVMRARSGACEACFPEGYRARVGIGIVGTVVASGKAILSNDVARDPRRILAFPEERATHAELCVPIRAGDRVLGALDILSTERCAFSEDDQASLEVLADQLAWVLHNARLFQDMRKLKEFHDQVLQSIPVPALLLDQEFRVAFANDAYVGDTGPRLPDMIGRKLDDIRPDSFLACEEGRKAVRAAFRTGEARQLERVTFQIGRRRPRIINLLVTRIDSAPDDRPLALVVVEDISESVEKAYESSLLRQIGQTTHGILELDRLIYAILTCVTAGTALGFNRAVIFLVDERQRWLQGTFGVGPANREEAGRIWSDMAGRNPSVEEILEQYDRHDEPLETPLCRAVRRIRIPLEATDDVLARVVRSRTSVAMLGNDQPLAVNSMLWSALETLRFVAVPLVGKNRVVGVIVADNFYSGTPITAESIELLEAFAGHAALAIENAALYTELEEKVKEIQRTQKELVQSERLAAIGQMSARIAHEIRNPLSVIGGFARSILRKPAADRVQAGAGIIVDEVIRLEKLLNETLDFTRSSAPELRSGDLNVLLHDVLEFLRADLDPGDIHFVETLDDALPVAAFDRDQIRQVLINITRNAIQAMPDGGAIRAASGYDADAERAWIEIADTGEGMSPEQLEQIFSPFFTTKTHGTGLGLVVSRKIVEDHGGRLVYSSAPGEGTVARIELPVSRTPSITEKNPIPDHA